MRSSDSKEQEIALVLHRRVLFSIRRRTRRELARELSTTEDTKPCFKASQRLIYLCIDVQLGQKSRLTSGAKHT